MKIGTIIKFFMGLIVLFVTIAIIGGGAAAWWASKEFLKPGSFDTAKEITVPAGAHIGGIADQLHYEGMISHPILFKLAGTATGQATKLKAGEYEIPARASIKEILDLLESGKVILRQITVREGLTNWEIQNLLLAHDGLAKGADFDLLPEGAYLPETYSYQKGDTAADIMAQMNQAMIKTIDALWETRAADLPFSTKEEALILASIIEKETAVADERERVAGVFVNRLRLGMPLQTDPSVIYALTLGAHKNDGQGPLGRRLLKKDLEIDSPYNTYKYVGLPPTPIANPGRASIAAALNPEKHDYLYFVADGNGGHAFGKTLDEHNRNVAKWRKIRAAQ